MFNAVCAARPDRIGRRWTVVLRCVMRHARRRCTAAQTIDLSRNARFPEGVWLGIAKALATTPVAKFVAEGCKMPDAAAEAIRAAWGARDPAALSM